MSIPLLPAAAAAHGFTDGISVHTAVLILLTAGVLYCVNAIAGLRRQLAQRSTSASNGAPMAPVVVSAPAAAPRREEISPAVIAVLAAAVHVTLGSRCRVLSVVPAAPGMAPWSIEGRRDVFRSHHLR